MAIALSCPSCDHELKVKDELAGRKIKCPKCSSVIAVLDKEDAEKARLAIKKNRQARADEDDDEPEEDERPKKKKKKKAKSKRGLIIGSAVGVLVLVVVLILIVTRSGPAKDQVVQKKADPQLAEPVVEAPAPPVAKESTGGVIRSMNRSEIENTLRQLGVAYKNFEVLANRGPKDQKELSPYYENNGRINEFLTNKWIVFIWGVPRNDGGFPDGYSNTILAYEGTLDRHNNRFVLYGDGSVHTMDEDTFKKTPKAKGK